MAADDAGAEISVATVVDVLGARASHCAINQPGPIQTKQVNSFPATMLHYLFESGPRFARANPFACVLNYLPPARNGTSRVYTKAVNFRAGDSQRVCCEGAVNRAESRSRRIPSQLKHYPLDGRIPDAPPRALGVRQCLTLL